MNKQDFIAAVNAAQLNQHLPHFEALMKDSIWHTLTPISDYADEPLGKSRIGGIPDLPPGMDWPRSDDGVSLSFVAQLNLAELKPFDTYQLLPDSGYLFFFYDSEGDMGGYSPGERHLFRVLYHNSNTLDQSPVKDYPEDIIETGRYYPCRLSFSNHISMPYKWGKDFSFFNEAERDVYGSKVWQGGIINKTLGHADIFQGEMEPLCEIVTSAGFDGDFKKFNQPEYDGLDARAKEEWVLLLQVDSNEDTAGMQWYNIGRLYFWIKKQDLLNKNFDRCWCIAQDM
ncbi:Uncharacterized protein YwqG [Filimonas lacunae]|uniref:Uncharacterized protein YwqG n=1 Tax=Filimonas lacunae TaxID=477680 RepID=A0A173M9C8_9BACT|nr:YwqG family protein [Filimonas lacunae]BAV04078.1 hypothetical protein FLA_0057 [Filimonas lacunae]SIT15689.1 Uncharacterized protein YwqG [Filimonas lacunae]